MKIEFVSDLRYNVRAVIEFLVAEKESLGKIHKGCVLCMEVVQSDRSTVRRWVQRVKASGSEETELHDRERDLGNIHKRLCAVYGSCAVDRSTVRSWVQRVKASGSEETELHDRERDSCSEDMAT